MERVFGKQGSSPIYQTAGRLIAELTGKIAFALTSAQQRGSELQREVDAEINFAMVVPVDGNYSVAIGTKEAGIGLKFYGRLHEAKACCESINNNIAAAIRANKQQ